MLFQFYVLRHCAYRALASLSFPHTRLLLASQVPQGGDREHRAFIEDVRHVAFEYRAVF